MTTPIPPASIPHTHAGATPDTDALRARMAVQGVVRRLLGANDPEYEDVLQTSLERVLTSIAGFSPTLSIAHWAAGVARHVTADALRARTRERRLLSRDRDAAALAHAGGGDAERLALAHERLAARRSEPGSATSSRRATATSSSTRTTTRPITEFTSIRGSSISSMPTS